jgi:hypothetical protein
MALFFPPFLIKIIILWQTNLMADNVETRKASKAQPKADKPDNQAKAKAGVAKTKSN